MFHLGYWTSHCEMYELSCFGTLTESSALTCVGMVPEGDIAELHLKSRQEAFLSTLFICLASNVCRMSKTTFFYLAAVF